MKEIPQYLLIPYYTDAARTLEKNWNNTPFDTLATTYPQYALDGRVQGVGDGLALFCKDQTNGNAFCIINNWDCNT